MLHHHVFHDIDLKWEPDVVHDQRSERDGARRREQCEERWQRGGYARPLERERHDERDHQRDRRVIQPHVRVHELRASQRGEA